MGLFTKRKFVDMHWFLKNPFCPYVWKLKVVAKKKNQVFFFLFNSLRCLAQMTSGVFAFGHSLKWSASSF